MVLLEWSAVTVWNRLYFSKARIMAQICLEGLGERWVTSCLACLNTYLAVALCFFKFARVFGEG